MSVSRSEPVIGSTTVVTSKYRFFVCGSPFSIALDDFRNYLINAASTLRVSNRGVQPAVLAAVERGGVTEAQRPQTAQSVIRSEARPVDRHAPPFGPESSTRWPPSSSAVLWSPPA